MNRIVKAGHYWHDGHGVVICCWDIEGTIVDEQMLAEAAVPLPNDKRHQASRGIRLEMRIPGTQNDLAIATIDKRVFVLRTLCERGLPRKEYNLAQTCKAELLRLRDMLTRQTSASE